MKVGWASAPVLLVLAGCGGPKGYTPKPVAKVEETPLSAATPEDILPLKEGNRWVYAIDTEANTAQGSAPETGELTIEVDRVVDQGDGKLATMRILRNDKQVDEQKWLVSSKGVYQTTGQADGKEITFSPPQPMILFPVTQDATFEWKGKAVCPDGSPGTVTAKYKVLGSMPVDTDLGKKSGIAIESTQDFKSSANKGGMAVTTWYAPKIGIVRILQTTVVPRGSIKTTLRLTKAPL